MTATCLVCGCPPPLYGPRFVAGRCRSCDEQTRRFVAIACARRSPFCSLTFTPQTADQTTCSYCQQVCSTCSKFAADGLGDDGQCLRCAVGRRSTAAATGPGLFDDTFRKDQ